MTENRMPSTKSGLTITAIGDEALAYDPSSRQAHALTPLLSQILARCDGHTPRSQVGEEVGGEEVLDAALVRLQAAGLVEGNQTRRAFLAGSGTAAAALALTSLALPTPAHASSACISAAACTAACSDCFCTNPSQCASNCSCIIWRCRPTDSSGSCATDPLANALPAAFNPDCIDLSSAPIEVNTTCSTARANAHQTAVGVACCGLAAGTAGGTCEGLGGFVYGCCGTC
ncbi:MAG: twin-arginine translocation signal domain-containing protein [Vulcanimicrobiota bacterium]